MTNKVEITLPSKSENEGYARACVAAFAAMYDPTISIIADIKTAVSEAVSNAVIHGYENKDGEIHIICACNDDVLTVRVIDKGVGINDIELARQPLYTSKPELERSGMGFTVMEEFMDSVKINSSKNNGTEVIMTKALK